VESSCLYHLGVFYPTEVLEGREEKQKLVFRFGEIRDSRPRKEAEYILVRTMLSFALAIGPGLLMNLCLSRPDA
jgi:hypothetical protein